MVKALARAFRWRKMLDTGEHATLEDLARAKGVHATYVSRVLRLTLLAPNIVEAILDGRQPGELQLEGLLERLPLDWGRQRQLLAIERIPVHVAEGEYAEGADCQMTRSTPRVGKRVASAIAST